jgi:hypothetical protein
MLAQHGVNIIIGGRRHGFSTVDPLPTFDASDIFGQRPLIRFARTEA